MAIRCRSSCTWHEGDRVESRDQPYRLETCGGLALSQIEVTVRASRPRTRSQRTPDPLHGRSPARDSRHHGASGRSTVLAFPPTASWHQRRAAPPTGRSSVPRVLRRARLRLHQTQRRCVAVPLHRGKLRQRPRESLRQYLEHGTLLPRSQAARAAPQRPVRRVRIQTAVRRLPRTCLGHHR